MQSILLYPSLCLFEGTNVSVGRGTSFPFQVFGSPYLKNKDFSFTPKPSGGAKNPKHQYKICYGTDLRETHFEKKLQLKWLIAAYESNLKQHFFNKFFTKLIGTTLLQRQIEEKMSEEAIRKSWEEGLNTFKKTRQKYLLYP